MIARVNLGCWFEIAGVWQLVRFPILNNRGRVDKTLGRLRRLGHYECRDRLDNHRHDFLVGGKTLSSASACALRCTCVSTVSAQAPRRPPQLRADLFFPLLLASERDLPALQHAVHRRRSDGLKGARHGWIEVDLALGAAAQAVDARVVVLYARGVCASKIARSRRTNCACNAAGGIFLDVSLPTTFVKAEFCLHSANEKRRRMDFSGQPCPNGVNKRNLNHP